MVFEKELKEGYRGKIRNLFAISGGDDSYLPPGVNVNVLSRKIATYLKVSDEGIRHD